MSLATVFRKVFGSKADRDLKKLQPVLAKVLAEYEIIDRLSDDALRAKSLELKEIIRQRTAADEARVAAEIVEEVQRRYGEKFHPRKTVGIIVPYRNQIAAIRAELERRGIAGSDRISIDTVERYQGSQRDVIIYSFTICKESQLSFLTANTFYENGRPIDRKLNVAITRARKQFIALGSRPLLSKNALFRKLIEAASPS
ncbi:MAG: hypothetical protein HUJ94_08210 [Bacteroidales bacterium]|nr:hypothetical protein [Bacteroidales bacterium]